MARRYDSYVARLVGWRACCVCLRAVWRPPSAVAAASQFRAPFIALYPICTGSLRAADEFVSASMSGVILARAAGVHCAPQLGSRRSSHCAHESQPRGAAATVAPRFSVPKVRQRLLWTARFIH